MDHDDDMEHEYEPDEDADQHGDIMDDEYGVPESSHAEEDVSFSDAVPPAQIRDFCLERFRTIDFIMEPVMMEHVNQYFAADGEAAGAIEALSNSYEGKCTVVDWLIGCMLGKLNDFPIDWLIDRSDWLIDWFDWLIDWHELCAIALLSIILK